MLNRLVFTLIVICSYCSSLSAEIFYDSTDQQYTEFGFVPLVRPNGFNSPFGILNNPSFHPGFFSAFFTVLGFLEEYEKSDWAGYSVDFENKGAFYESSMGNNWWTYYFNPLYKEAAGTIDKRVIKEEQKMVFKIRTVDGSRPDVYRIIQKYIQVNERVQNEVNSAIRTIFEGHPVIGVNFQKPERSYNSSNTDFSKYFDSLDLLLALEENVGCKIFVSTDDEYFLELMFDHYGFQVVNRDVPRYSILGKPTYNTLTPNFDRGFDEIVECILLSKCHTIIGNNAHICIAASFFEPTLKLINARTTGKK